MIKLLIIILFFRITLVFLPSFRIDMNSWQTWSTRLMEVTPINFYAPNYFADYFPGYLYILWFLGILANLLQMQIFSIDFEYYLKFFTNLFDFATAFYIYKIVRNYKESLAITAAIFYLANPALIFNSSVWGQTDGILTFFLIYSIYSLLELKQIYHFSLFSALSILVKPQGLAVLPVMIIYLIKNFDYKKYISLTIIPILLILFSLPFFLKDPILGLFHLLQKNANAYPYTSMFSYNFWSFAGWWVSDTTTFWGLKYQIWGFIIYFFMLAIIILPLFLKAAYKNKYFIYFACTLASFSFFLFLTRIHERYLFPFFAFLLIVVLIKKSVKLRIIYVVLSLIHFLNLWYVYYFYNYAYNDSSFSSQPLFQLLDNNYNLSTILNLIGFGVLVLMYYKSIRDEKVS